MLTYEKVLVVFNDFLTHDKDCEVITTKRGYVVLNWDSPQSCYATAKHCETPEALMENLLSTYHSELTVRTHHEDLTEQEAAEIEVQCNILREKCKA